MLAVSQKKLDQQKVLLGNGASSTSASTTDADAAPGLNESLMGSILREVLRGPELSTDAPEPATSPAKQSRPRTPPQPTVDASEVAEEAEEAEGADEAEKAEGADQTEEAEAEDEAQEGAASEGAEEEAVEGAEEEDEATEVVEGGGADEGGAETAAVEGGVDEAMEEGGVEEVVEEGGVEEVVEDGSGDSAGGAPAAAMEAVPMKRGDGEPTSPKPAEAQEGMVIEGAEADVGMEVEAAAGEGPGLPHIDELKRRVDARVAERMGAWIEQGLTLKGVINELVR